MRIAILCHANQSLRPEDSRHAVDVFAQIWREEGHEVRLLAGCRHRWAADVAILHVDLSIVPDEYVAFARQYPVVVNGRILDNRKSTVSRNLVDAGSDYSGPVIVKTDLNSGGLPERKLWKHRARSGFFGRVARRLRPRAPVKAPGFGLPEGPAGAPKPYRIYDSLRHVPADVLSHPDLVLEKFRPEREGEWYYVRRCFVLGDRAISYRMGDRQPIVEAGLPEAFEWVDNAPEVLSAREEVGLDYGTIDHTVHDGEVVVLDVNKTPGRAAVRNEDERRGYENLLRRISTGVTTFRREPTASTP